MHETMDLIWKAVRSPGLAFDEAIRRKPRLLGFVLLWAFCVDRIFWRMEGSRQGVRGGAGIFLTLAIVIAPLMTFVVWYLLAGLVHLGARLMRGQGNTWQTRAAFTFATLPYSLGLLMALFLLAYFGPQVLSLPAPVKAGGLYQKAPYLAALLMFGQVILGIWSAVLLVITLRKVHRFGTLRAIGALAALPVAITLVLSALSAMAS